MLSVCSKPHQYTKMVSLFWTTRWGIPLGMPCWDRLHIAAFKQTDFWSLALLLLQTQILPSVLQCKNALYIKIMRGQSFNVLHHFILFPFPFVSAPFSFVFKIADIGLKQKEILKWRVKIVGTVDHLLYTSWYFS